MARRAERAAVGSLLAALGEPGARAEVQATALHTHPGERVAAHAGVAALGALLVLVAPWAGTLLLAAAAASAWTALRGGRGWIGRALPRQVGHNVVLWGERPLGGRERPCLVVAAPYDGGPAQRPHFGKAAPLLAAPGILAVAGIAARPFAPGASPPLLLWSAAGFALVVLGGLAHRLLRPMRPEPGPAGRALRAVAAELQAHPTAHLDVVISFLSGGAHAGDSLEVLLRNHRARLDPNWTRVLLLQPDRDGPRYVRQEGWVRPRPPDPRLLDASVTAGLPEAPRLTPAALAARAGWRAGALLVAGEEDMGPALRMVRALDADAGEGRW